LLLPLLLPLRTLTLRCCCVTVLLDVQFAFYAVTFRYYIYPRCYVPAFFFAYLHVFVWLLRGLVHVQAYTLIRCYFRRTLRFGCPRFILAFVVRLLRICVCYRPVHQLFWFSVTGYVIAALPVCCRFTPTFAVCTRCLRLLLLLRVPRLRLITAFTFGWFGCYRLPRLLCYAVVVPRFTLRHCLHYVAVVHVRFGLVVGYRFTLCPVTFARVGYVGYRILRTLNVTLCPFTVDLLLLLPHYVPGLRCVTRTALLFVVHVVTLRYAYVLVYVVTRPFVGLPFALLRYFVPVLVYHLPHTLIVVVYVILLLFSLLPVPLLLPGSHTARFGWLFVARL